jgi:hypothetical protein
LILRGINIIGSDIMTTDTLRICTGHGRIDLLHPRPEDVDLRDVVINLSRIRRWTGAVDFTVGQHAQVVEMMLWRAGHIRETCLGGLTHDCHEYATNDLAAMIKDQTTICGIPLKQIQANVQDAIEAKMQIGRHDEAHKFNPIDHEAIHAADMAARSCEVWWLLPDGVMTDELRAEYPEPDPTTWKDFVRIFGQDRYQFMYRVKSYGVEVCL